MPAHLVFITLFLGIVSGKQQVDLQADPGIAWIRLALGGQEIARLTQPPWHTSLDLGAEILPRELAAIGFDANGNEIARATQILNLPRATAEVQIVPADRGVQLRWTNLEFAAPKSAIVRFDGATLSVDRDFLARFPVYADWTRPHIIDAELRFADGVVARREVVLEGTRFAETAETELTPVLVTETSPKPTADLAGCFSIDGNPARVSAIDKDKAHVIFVQDPDPREIAKAIDPMGRAWNMYSRAEFARLVHFDEDTTQEILWPIAQRYADRSTSAASRLFEHSREMESRSGVIAPLTLAMRAGFNLPRQFADAVAVAGARALSGGRRRAIVLVLTDSADPSISDPRAVRHYLAAIGVPLFVWSVAAPAGAAERWGTIDDISTIDHLRSAVDRVRKTLAAQRVAWVQADPFSALRVQASERCGYAVVH